MTSSLEHSFKSRLRNIAREMRLDPAQLWRNLVLERFLVRLYKSKHASRFILKGGGLGLCDPQSFVYSSISLESYAILLA